MSYAFTCYCNDPTIFTTSVYVHTIGVSYSNYYGSSTLGDWSEFSVGGFDSSWAMQFTATPASGCSFSYWAYRVGSTSAALQYNYNQTFTYYGGQDIYIRAVGTSGGSGGDDDDTTTSWTRITGTIGTISSSYTELISMSPMTIYRYRVSFTSSGIATFQTSGSIDTYGYLGTTTGWDSSTGKPTSYLTLNNDGDDRNFSISYQVTAGTNYYIWVRGYYSTASGTTYLIITPPASRPSNFSWTYAKTQGQAFNLTATEWNSFTSKINEFRRYKGLSNYSFTYAYKGDTFTAAMYNQARKAIQAVDGYGTYIPTVSAGDNITAYAMNVLVSELNSIP